ncbi:fasciclin domain-containing protein [Olleya aquimaris]|uniref:Putative surface protein with fasciclin (FAS1) repeats n=1 Tax=Olleya aquimaris TaxID=639310 RepID=A0A327RGY3_9FLAO|nr:fasciclin domain-containing protein [Olleya aquimaris]RAJ12987.1 putative surface protein with fasciclin (FAS1) repeats [Olleya aquimaris]
MKTIQKLSLLFLATFVLWSCSDDDDATQQPMPQQLNIVATAQATPSLSILVEAVVQAGLVDALSADGSRTVLAPTNDAFTAFLAAKGFASLSDVPNDVLTQILLNHVIDGANILSTDLAGSAGYTTTLASGPNNTNLSLYWDGTSGVTFNGYADVDIADISTSNGIVHVVDAVIDLPTLATFATTNPALEDLVTALGSADSQTPSPMFVSTLADAQSGPLTVFTPTNDAFDALLLELDPSGMTELGDIDPATVEAVLNIHIVSGNVQSSGLMTGPVTTLGGTIDVDTSNFTITDPLNRVINIVTSLVDIQAVNGVVHVVDRVIRP